MERAMIRGIGVDIADIGRIRALLEKHGERFTKRVFTEGEMALCARKGDPSLHLAARFAAKEAAAKALGTGLAGGVRFIDIEVLGDDGPPRLMLHGRAGEIAKKIGVTRTHLSMTHERGGAAAFVILEGDD
jgi:holo-[acyl-carrier protein] synthase